MQTYVERTLLAALLMALLAAPPHASANIVIDFDAVMAVDSYSQATMDAVGQTTFYFEHASVGSNMTDGLRARGFYALAAETTVIPESATYALWLGAGTLGLALLRCRRRPQP